MTDSDEIGLTRSQHNKILEESIREFVDYIIDIAHGGQAIHSYPFIMDDDAYIYNLEVSKVQFPVWICMGGEQVPKDGCRTIHSQDKPLRCKNCGNTDFKEIEDREQLQEWRDNYD